MKCSARQYARIGLCILIELSVYIVMIATLAFFTHNILLSFSPPSVTVPLVDVTLTSATVHYVLVGAFTGAFSSGCLVHYCRVTKRYMSETECVRARLAKARVI